MSSLSQALVLWTVVSNASRPVADIGSSPPPGTGSIGDRRRPKSPNFGPRATARGLVSPPPMGRSAMPRSVPGRQLGGTAPGDALGLLPMGEDRPSLLE